MGARPMPKGRQGQKCLNEIEANERTKGKDAARFDYLPIHAVEELCAGEHPVRVWRKHRKLTRAALAALAGVTPSHVTEIETGKKPGNFNALDRLAAALKISLDEITAWTTQKA
jgi:DNA-binding XRE family transcriptional regulator